ncbi:hypothetical protein ACLQ2E_36090 [Streptomyces lavendulocolor]
MTGSADSAMSPGTVPPGDLGTPPARARADRLAALDDAAGGRLPLGPRCTRTPEDQPARTH